MNLAAGAGLGWTIAATAATPREGVTAAFLQPPASQPASLLSPLDILTHHTCCILHFGTRRQQWADFFNPEVDELCANAVAARIPN
jgi:hypothetical protein